MDNLPSKNEDLENLRKINFGKKDLIGELGKKQSNFSQNQIQDLIFGKEIEWQEIIYDLINTEQLNPWDVDIVLLTDKYLEKIRTLEEMDFFISSKVLLAAALLLRIKSEILLNKELRSIDEILFGKREEKKKNFERLEFNEGELPMLIPKSPIPRFKKVTLKELMDSLNKAIATENRRIKKEIINKNALRFSELSLPKDVVSINDKIISLNEKILKYFKENLERNRISFSELTGEDRKKKLDYFFPLLELDNQSVLWLEQNKPFEEFYIWIKDVYLKENDPLIELRQEIENIEEEIYEDYVDEEEKEF